MHLPEYEELYVVSDLHLGGTKGAPIFDQTQELASLIVYLAERPPKGQGTLALLLNGDVIDTLAEDIERYVSFPREAELVLTDIFQRFEPVWSALSTFVTKPGHLLIIAIGNHDIELAYPNVQELITKHLAKDDPAARARVAFEVSGSGHRCRVGSVDAGFASTLCVHGNEFDEWNAIDPEYLTRLVRASKLGVISARPDDPPNAGTQFVIDVMNRVKKTNPFVDLLKPEVESVFNVLVAIEPKNLTAIPGFGQAASRAFTEGKGRVRRVLGESPRSDVQPDVPPAWQPGSHFAAFLGQRERGSDLLEEAWRDVQAGKDPEDVAELEGVLGVGDFFRNTARYVANIVKNKRPEEALRCALLDWVGSDKTWDLDGPDSVRDQLAKLRPNASVVVAGHTHLRRQQRLDGASGPLYLNTGTWARLMQLTENDLRDDNAFKKVWSALKEQSMSALDGLKVIHKQPTVAVIRPSTESASVVAALCEFKGDLEDKSLVRDCQWEQVGAP